MKINEIKGAGDVVEAALKVIGVKKPKGCRCKERKEFLNKAMKNPLYKEGTDGD